MAQVIVGILVWQMLLSAAVVAGIVVYVKDRRRITVRESELDMQAGMQDIARQLQRINLQEHQQLRTAVELFLKRCKADPITAERRHLDIIELESILNHGR